MENERIKITRHGEDDYSVSFSTADFSVRGTYREVMQTIRDYARAELLRDYRKGATA